MPTLFLVLRYSQLAVIVIATIEAAVLALHRRAYGRRAYGSRAYDWRAYAASAADALIREYVVYDYLKLSGAAWLVGLAWAHRLATIPLGTVTSIVIMFVVLDFSYYWFHRCSHRMRWLWASHAVHHSSNELNLGAAYRFGWTGRLAGSGAFYAPMIWLGFAPRAVFVTLSVNLLYQFWLHATWIPRLGPLEYVLNTPSHHRVHHAANPEYLDRNYGGVLIVFDRLFGTFAAERDAVPCRYGLVEPLRSNNPLVIATHEWRALARDLWQAPGWRARLRTLLGPPDAGNAAARDCSREAVAAE